MTRVANPSSDWFTAVRVRRMAQVLVGTDGAAPGIPEPDAIRVIWRSCGGQREEIGRHLELLIGLGFVRLRNSAYYRTTSGNKLAKAAKRHDNTALALALIRAGFFHDHARLLLESGTIDGSGQLVVMRRLALAVAPQLVAILDLWGDVQVRPRVVIPQNLVGELEAAWALLPPEPDTPEWALARKAVGNRAELYTFQLERSRATDKSSIVWVARDSDSLGWDVEDRSEPETRCIEVKGRRDRDEIFYLSDNEWKKANELGERYEVQFWGAIDLTREPALEYAALLGSGYPVLITNLAQAIAGDEWTATAVRWKVQRTNEP